LARLRSAARELAAVLREEITAAGLQLASLAGGTGERSRRRQERAEEYRMQVEAAR